jgi:uncharacterized protein with von Willebrand factor type A (vWA) domain
MDDEDADARQEHQELKKLLVVLDKNDPGDADLEHALTKLMAATATTSRTRNRTRRTRAASRRSSAH